MHAFCDMLAFAQLLPAGFGAPISRLTWPELRKLTDMHDVYKKQLALTGHAQLISGADLLCQENGVSFMIQMSGPCRLDM